MIVSIVMGSFVPLAKYAVLQYYSTASEICWYSTATRTFTRAVTYIPWRKTSHFPVCNDLIQTSLLLDVESVAVAFFVVPIVHHVEASRHQRLKRADCASGLIVRDAQVA
jgi:hypothetical protein